MSGDGSKMHETMNDKKRAGHLALTLWAVLASTAALAYLGFHSYPLLASEADPELVDIHARTALPGRLLFLLTVTSPLPLMVSAFGGLRANANHWFWIRAGILFLVPWCAFVASRQLSWPVTRSVLERSAERAEPLIQAIERHERARGRPPDSLKELGITIPTTGIPAYPRYRYAVRRDGLSRVELWWYDLGPRSGRSLTHQWRSADGEIDHAVLVIRLDARGRVREAFADRMPVRSPRDKFDRKRWSRERATRIAIVKSALDSVLAGRKRRADVIRALGEPDGKRVEVDAPWELRVASSPAELDRPSFFYWPSRSYPAHIDGSPVRRLGDWAYLQDPQTPEERLQPYEELAPSDQKEAER